MECQHIYKEVTWLWGT